MRKTSLIISVVVLAILSVWAYKHFIVDSNKMVDPIIAVPPDAILILDIADGGNSLEQFYESSLLWKNFEQTRIAGDFKAFIILLDSINNNNRVTFSVHRPDSEYHSLVCIADPNRELFGILKNKGKPDSTDKSIYSIFGLSYLFTYSDDVVLVSSDTKMLNRAKAALNDNNSITEDDSFVKIRALNDNDADQNLYLNLDRLKEPLDLIIKNPDLKFSSDLSGWSLLELFSKSNMITGRGFIQYDLTNSNILTIFEEQTPQSINYLEVLPVKTALFKSMGFSNAALFIENLSKTILQSEESDKIKNYLASWMGGAIGMGILENDNPVSDSKYAFIGLRDSVLFEEKAAQFLDENAEQIKYWGYHFRRFDKSFDLSLLFGENYNGIKNPYFIKLESYVFYAKDPETLKSIIKQFKNDQTLGKAESFAVIQDELLDDASMVYYFSPAVGQNFLTEYLNDSIVANWLPQAGEINNLQAMVIQLSSFKKGLVYIHSIIKHQHVELAKRTNALWESEINAEVVQKPQLVIDYNSGNYDVVVQDTKNNLSLLNNTGELLWEYHLGKPILSEIEQIDIYKNGKLQLLFNTSDSLFCIDRKGRNVGKYPIALPDTTSNALALLDYDKNKNYRILIGTATGRIIMYDAKGNKVKGWKFVKVRSAINEQIKHIKIGKKDYIFASTANGTILLLDRKGKSRYQVKENIVEKQGQSFIYTGKNIQESGVYYIDTLGQVIKLPFNGKKDYLAIKGEKGDQLFVKYLKNQNKYGFLVFNESDIVAFSSDGSKLIDNIFVNNLESAPRLYWLNNENWIGYTDTDKKQGYLVNFNGELYQDFPVKGISPFSIRDINKDGILELVIADETGGIIVYALMEE